MFDSVFDLKWTLKLSGVWLGVNLNTDSKKMCVEEKPDGMFKIW